MELPSRRCISCARRCSTWLDRLPGPQRDALATTFGLSEGAAPDRLLRRPGGAWACSRRPHEERPLLCVVDDAQWLDRASAQALAFVARRLRAEPVVDAVRRARAERGVRGTAGAGGRGPRAIGTRATLLASVIPGRLDERVADQLVAETRGNPLALFELPRGLSPRSWQGASGCRARSRSRAGSRRASCGGSRHCPRPPGGCCWSRRPSLSAIRRCCGVRPSGLGIAGPALEPAESRRADRDRQPGAVSPSAGALRGLPGRIGGGAAASASGVGGGDRRARPIPIGAPGTSPRRRPARTRTSPPSWSGRPAGHRRAADWPPPPRSSSAPRRLTPDPVARARRALAAAQAKYEAGALDDALALLATAETGGAR